MNDYRRIISDIEQEIARLRNSIADERSYSRERNDVECRIRGMLDAMAIVERYANARPR